MLEPLTIRRERPGDAAAIRDIVDSAFGQSAEGEIVDRLRRTLDPESGDLWISLVAERAGELVGHILFSEVIVRPAPGSAGGGVAGRAAGLAPMAVSPPAQKQGVGSRLVREGLAACRAAGYPLVVVLGHPTYYPRFGFSPAIELGLGWEHEAPAEAFMALELEPGAAGAGGTVSYRPEFSG